MGLQWAVVVLAVVGCLLDSPEARPQPSKTVASLRKLPKTTQDDLNKVWDQELSKQQSKDTTLADQKMVKFFDQPGGDRYVYGFDANDAKMSHLQASDGKGQTIGKYSYTDADGKDVEVHYVAGKSGFKVISNNLPEETEDVKKAKEEFFKVYNEAKNRKTGHTSNNIDDILGKSVVDPVEGNAIDEDYNYEDYVNYMDGEEEEEGDGEEEDEEEEDDEEEDEDEEDSDEEDEDDEEDSSSSSEEDSSSSEEDSSSSEEDDEEDSDEEEDEDEEDEDEEEEEEGSGDGGEGKEGEEDEEDEDEEDEEDSDDEDDEDSSSSSSSSSSSEEDDEDEDEDDEDEENEEEMSENDLLAKFDKDFGRRLYSHTITYGG